MHLSLLCELHAEGLHVNAQRPAKSPPLGVERMM